MSWRHPDIRPDRTGSRARSGVELSTASRLDRSEDSERLLTAHALPPLGRGWLLQEAAEDPCRCGSSPQQGRCPPEPHRRPFLAASSGVPGAGPTSGWRRSPDSTNRLSADRMSLRCWRQVVPPLLTSSREPYRTGVVQDEDGSWVRPGAVRCWCSAVPAAVGDATGFLTSRWIIAPGASCS